MKKLIITSLLLLGLWGVNLQAQKIDVKWSEKQYYDNKGDGFSKFIIGSNSKFVYAYYERLRLTNRRKQGDKIKIVAFEKNSMKRVSDVPLIGFPENIAESRNFDNLDYYKTIVFEDIIYVVWKKDLHDKKNTEELYVQTFNQNLKKLNGIKKVYELGSDGKADFMSKIFLLGNKNANQQIIMGGELSSKKGENVKVEYKVLNKDFTFAANGKFELPIQKIKDNDALSGDYEFGNDGNIYIKSYVRINRDDVKEAKKSGNALPLYSYAILTMVNPLSGKTATIPIRADNKDVFDFDYTITQNKIKIYGFYCDLTKINTGMKPKALLPGFNRGIGLGIAPARALEAEAIHGIFSGTIDNSTFELNKINFTAFTKSQLDKLFENDKGDRKERHFLASKKKKDQADVTLRSDYRIEKSLALDDDNLVLFCSRMENYVVCHTNSNGKGGGTTTCENHCDKSNVTVFKLNNDGAIVWASNLDRFQPYIGHNIYDVEVMVKGKQMFAFYAQEEQNKNEFEYTVFDYETGKYAIQNYIINNPNTPKSEAKKMLAQDVKVIDNIPFVNSYKKHMKIGPTAAWCGASIVCLPLLYVVIMNQNLRYGAGNIGVIKTVNQ